MDSEQLTQRLMAAFRPELEEHLTTLGDGLLALEEGVGGEAREHVIAEVFRAAHSLKGAARGVGLRDIEAIAHALENILADVKHGTLHPTPELVDRVLPALDAIREAMAAHLAGARLPADHLRDLLAALAGLGDGSSQPPSASVPPRAALTRNDGGDRTVVAALGAEPATVPQLAAPARDTGGDSNLLEPTRAEPAGAAPELPAEPQPPAAMTGTIRVATEKLDALMEDAGELLSARLRSDRQLRELQALQRRLSAWSKSWRAVSGQVGALRRSDHHDERRGAASSTDLRPLLDFLGCNEVNLKDVSAGLSRLVGMAASTLQGLTLVSDTVQDSVRSLRMVPAATLIARFPRMVRDLARERGKEVALRIVGADLEIDRWVLEAIADPLTHLLRNAVDHGVEAPTERVASGKPRRGVVTLQVAQTGGTIVIEVADDGAGIDPGSVLRAATGCGAVTPEAAARLSQPEVLQLVFRSGVSTAAAVTELSGRGVGLDVVRTNLERLHGTIAVHTASGRGTTFTMTVPLTLATVAVLLAEAAGRIVAIPTTVVERILRVNLADVRRVDGRPTLHLGGGPVALFSLAQALGLPDDAGARAKSGARPTIAVAVAERRRAFMVDAVLGAQEVVVKSLGWPLERVRNVAGCCVLGGGEVAIVLNFADLISSATPTAGVAATVVAERRKGGERKVLLVDDSITTRILEKNILENAGFRVVAATDGEEAWALMRGERPQIVVSDVAMPRLDGIDLTRRIRADAALKEVPVVLVTSLDSPQDRLRGLEAGADAYITKGTFDQHELLATIERLLG